ncbi:uncharacterized protein LOC130567325 [Triplophysa rosa]|uniref:uncharacterized protein LOC130567325 n=1 Tax=Triplophysa rosa TaxID=992332 RepID=UPI002545EAF7|nr:uncharacterized protein LOC130567325 [Triplophysa rosa]
MAKRMIKTKFTLDEVVEECTRRNSDQSEDDISDEENDVSSIDTVAEDLFLDGGDVTLDKQSNETDEDWEPSSKKPYTNRQDDSTSSEDKPQTSPTQRDSASKRPRGIGRARGRGRTASTSGQAEMSIPTSEERWNDVDVPDVTPPQPTFRPTKSPGPQLIRTANYTALQLFQLFFTNSVLLTIIKNTNDFGSTAVGFHQQ